MELQTLDQQLKVAIQNHQILVAKMKSDPQNGNLQKMLHDLQSRIRILSEKQKQVVQQLRKDIEIKKQQATGSGVTNNNNNNNNNHASVVSKGVMSGFAPPNMVTSLPQQVLPLSLSMKQVESRFATILLPAKVTLSPACLPHATAVVAAADQQQKSPPQLLTVTTAILPPNATPTIIYRPQPEAPRLPPPIRVPQYPPVSLQSSPPPPTSALAPHNNNVLKAKNKWVEHGSGDRQKAVLDPDVQKKKFMAALGLITHDMLTELKSRKSERKRRTTANPQFSYGNWEHHSEKKSSGHYLASHLPAGFKRPRGRPRLGSATPSRPSTPEDHPLNGSTATTDASSFMRLLHNGLLAKEESVCVICRAKGELVQCSVCLLGYHAACLPQHPPTDEHWTCPNCQLLKKKNSAWPRSLSTIHSYILHKTAKEEEKRQLVQRGLELKEERDQLELRSKQLSEQLSTQVKARTELLLDTKSTLESIEQLKSSVRLLQTS